MTMRERMLAVVRGEPVDRVPFVQYSGIAGPNQEIWQQIGDDRMGLLQWCQPYRLEAPHSRWESEGFVRDGRPHWRDRLATPAGVLTAERVRVPGLAHVSTFVRHYIETADDYRIFLSYLRDITVVEDAGAVQRVVAAMGPHGLPHISLGRTPYQQLWVQWVALAQLALHLVDEAELVEGCMERMGEVFLAIADAAWRTAEVIDMPYVVIADNISAPLIGEPRFRRYCLPYYRAVADRMADRGVPLFVHMDGDLRPLWDAIGETGMLGIDSLSPPPDNDTSVAEAVVRWPRMRLLVNFPSSVHLADPETVYARAAEILAQGGHTGRLQIQISEDPPPGAWRKSFPAIVRAIEEYGRG